MSGLGWFPDWDPDGRGWRPNLQIEGACLPVDIWTETEEQCWGFIRDLLLPAASQVIDE